MKILFRTHNHIGDCLITTAVVRDFKTQYPNYLIGVDTAFNEVFENNPYIDWSINSSNADKIIKLEYAGSQSYGNAGHCINGWIKCLNRCLNINIKLSKLKVDLYWKINPPIYKDYWVINAGYQRLSTVKNLGLHRYQYIVDNLPEIKFIQIGGNGKNDICRPLERVENLTGQTTLKDIYSLLSGCNGLLSPPSFAVHMNVFDKPSLVLNGGREPSILTQYDNTIHFTSSCIFYRKKSCMKFIAEKSSDRRSCLDSIKFNDEYVPKCMLNINTLDIINKIKEIELAKI